MKAITKPSAEPTLRKILDPLLTVGSPCFANWGKEVFDQWKHVPSSDFYCGIAYNQEKKVGPLFHCIRRHAETTISREKTCHTTMEVRLSEGWDGEESNRECSLMERHCWRIVLLKSKERIGREIREDENQGQEDFFRYGIADEKGKKSYI